MRRGSRMTKTAPTNRALRYRIGTIRQAGDGRTRVRIRHIIPLRLENRMFPHTFPDRLFQLRGLEQGRSIRDPGDGLIRLEDFAGHAHVDFLAGLEVEAEPAEHEGD